MMTQDLQSGMTLVAERLAQRGSKMFASTPGVLVNYVLARDMGYLRVKHDTVAIIVRRFETNPRYRIYQVDMHPDDLLDIAEELAQNSWRPVVIENLTPVEVELCDRLDAGGIPRVSEEAILDCSALAGSPRDFFTKRTWEAVRSNLRSMDWVFSDGVGWVNPQHRQDAITVVDLWKKANAHKHFRLSITRDYRSIDSEYADYRLIGYRGGSPACLHLLTKHIACMSLAVELVEKSLNYTALPGGKPGTSDTNFYVLARQILESGITHVNLGTWDGGNPGLGRHKHMLTSGTDPVYSGTFTTSFKDRRFS